MIGLYSANSQAGVSLTPLLDEYGGAAAAYSVRRLSSTYTGALMEVRRTVSSTTVTADVAYDSNNELSLDSEITVTGGSSSATNLGEFVAATGYSDPDSLGSGQDAFVRTWYDQSGNSNNTTQSTAADQRRIVSSGVVDLLNGKPSLKGGERTQFFTIDLTSLTNENSWEFSVQRYSSNLIITRRLSDNARYFYAAQNGSSSTAITSSVGTPTIFINGNEFSGTTRGQLYNLITTNQNLSTVGNLTGINRSFETGYIGTGNTQQDFQELIIYDSDQSANRTGIESNINTYFNIYS